MENKIEELDEALLFCSTPTLLFLCIENSKEFKSYVMTFSPESATQELRVQIDKYDGTPKAKIDIYIRVAAIGKHNIALPDELLTIGWSKQIFEITKVSRFQKLASINSFSNRSELILSTPIIETPKPIILF